MNILNQKNYTNSFNQKVWFYTKQIPKGKISTYKEIAKACGSEKKARAVGNALNKSPGMPEVPCHRVVKTSGKTGGFAFGTKKKQKMLKEEGLNFEKGRITEFEKHVITATKLV